MNTKVKKLTFSAMIAAIYFVCCFFEQEFASGAVQCRISEGFTLLPLFFPEAILGVTLGCLIFNATTGIWWDMVFGTLATLIGCVITWLIGKKVRNDWLRILLGGIPPVVLNALIVPVVLINGYGLSDAYWYLGATVGAGELIAVYAVGILVYFPLKAMFEKYHFIDREADE